MESVFPLGGLEPSAFKLPAQETVAFLLVQLGKTWLSVLPESPSH